MSDDFTTHSNINWQGHVGTVEYGGGDRGMVALFYNRSVHNPSKSAQHGRPYFEDKVFVRIHPPGERLNIIDRPATDSDRRRWPTQWAQFRDNREQTPEGTPVDLLYPDHPSVASMLRAFGVFTIEQCAELSGPAIDSIGMGAQRYVNDAKKYLEASTKGVQASQLRRELDERDNQISTLNKQIEILKREVENLREINSTAVTNEQLQVLLANMGARPTYPGAKQLAPAFDAQATQIAAVNQATRGAPKNPPASKKRQRIKV